MSFLMSLVMVVSVSSENLDQVSLAFAHPKAPIVCPTFTSKGNVLSSDKQYDLCLKRVVEPLEAMCFEQGFDVAECNKRTMFWLIKQNIKK